MALFLESVESTVSAKYNDLSFNEMLCEGMLIGDEMLALNEAIYKADFIIHQRSQNLSESAKILQESGFLGSVWEKVKNMVSKVWEWIKATWTKFTAKLSEWANRIMDRLSGNTKEVRKSLVKSAEIIESAMEKHINDILKTVNTATAAKDNDVAKDYITKFNENSVDLKEQLTDAEKLEGKVKVSATFYKKVMDTARRIQKAINTALSALSKLSSQLDKDTKDVAKQSAAGDDGESIKEEDAAIQMKIGIIKVMTTELKSLATGSTLKTFSALLTTTNSISADDIDNSKAIVRKNSQLPD